MTKIYPRTGDKQTVYLNAVVKDPRIEVGDYTIYNDFVADPLLFEKNNVLYHYPIHQERLVIGKFCSIACGTKFLFNCANHTLKSLSTYTFPLFYEEWGLKKSDITDAWDDKGDIIIGNDVWIGADVVLLIAACLSPSQVQEFTALAHELNLEVLLEIHTEEELKHFNSEIDLVGINNRNLKDFKVDLQHSVNLKNLLPKGTLSVAESGIYNVEDFKFLKEKGFDAFLMGEYFMKNENPGKMFEEFVKLI